MLTTKNQNLNLNMFLHSITCLFNKNTNKYYNIKLDDTNDIKFSLNNLLDFDLIKIFLKLYVSFCTNRTILNISYF
jgi:hypothetical protein